MSTPPNETTYVVGGTVQASGGIYIERNADKALIAQCLKGSFCYLLSSRQVGKSSLIVHAAEQLISRNYKAAVIDLSGIGTSVKSADAWYRSVLTEVATQLMLPFDAAKWWDQKSDLAVTHRFTLFFRELVNRSEDRFVIFVDEIDTTLALTFTDDFFAAIRSLYNARSSAPELQRLSFVLAGVATPSQLIQDPNRTPFNLGERIELTDFTADEALPLAAGLMLEPENAAVILRSVLEWTGGHPYLTLRVFQSLQSEPLPPEFVERRVQDLFLRPQGLSDNNLQFVREMLIVRAGERIRPVLETYGDVWRGEPVPDLEKDPVVSWLKLSGIVKPVNNTLQVRCRIYREAFNADWIRKNLPSTGANSANSYVAGGTVQAARGIYVERAADAILMHHCRTGAYVYLSSARQMGRSSMIFHTAEGLIGEGFSPVIEDLSLLGGGGTEDQWYAGLTSSIAQQLKLTADLTAWWEARSQLAPSVRFRSFLEDVVLRQIRDRVVIFLDETSDLATLPFGRDFLSTIRFLYNARATAPQFDRLSFVLVGELAPLYLSADPAGFPFAISATIELTDFTFQECAPLIQGLGLPWETATKFLRDVLDWTGGHPYLTLKVFRSIADDALSAWDAETLEARIQSLFLNATAQQFDSHLSFIGHALTTTQTSRWGPRQLLGQIESIALISRTYIRSDGSSDELKRIGIVIEREQQLRFRNRIYEQVFNRAWVAKQLANLPPPRPQPKFWKVHPYLTAIGLVVLLTALILAFMYLRNQGYSLSHVTR